MKTQIRLNTIKNRKKARIRAKIFGTATRPRLSVFRSNSNIFLQLIDDEVGKTLVSASTKELTIADKKKKKIDQATIVAELLGKKAKEKKITTAVFDRGYYAYHGRVKAIADAARKEIKI